MLDGAIETLTALRGRTAALQRSATYWSAMLTVGDSSSAPRTRWVRGRCFECVCQDRSQSPAAFTPPGWTGGGGRPPFAAH